MICKILDIVERDGKAWVTVNFIEEESGVAIRRDYKFLRTEDLDKENLKQFCLDKLNEEQALLDDELKEKAKLQKAVEDAQAFIDKDINEL